MTIRKAYEFEKKKGDVCCIEDCENIASFRGSDGWGVVFFRFSKFWRFERRFCEEHKHLMHSSEVKNLIDRRKRRWVKPYSCGCGRQATKSLRGILSANKTLYIEGYGVCERCYKNCFNEEVEKVEKRIEKLLDGCEELVLKDLRNIVGLIDLQLLCKESEDVVKTEDGYIPEVEFDKKKIH